jgi:hypothetical protein
MAHRKASKRSKARTMLRLADLELRFSTRSAQRARKNHTVIRSTSLSGGIAPNHVFHSTELLSFATGFFSNRKTSRPPRSMCA